MPDVWPWLVRGFGRYSRRYLSRHFHSLLLSRAGGVAPGAGAAIVVYLNHASWWDPLVCLELHNRCYPGRPAFAPMDAAALNRYPAFRRLGFFPVEQGTRRCATAFLRTAQAILRQPSAALWITPQGCFTDVRQRPVRFHSGLGHLVDWAAAPALFVPLALEYVFWDERLPMVLARFGEPVSVEPRRAQQAGPSGWTGLLECRLEATQDALAAEAQLRDPALFEPLLQGRSGVGWVYDGCRRLCAAWRGERFQAEHRIA